ncbi:MAG: Cof-type HAD-IIB family hydrolase [Anaerolineae bacterium]|nr:Cof-type HAD-IIB family hydrolase [Thermoflexales bacterium]MDW8406219.1 Cof-type HAD-IIB family hydrolase [Anaerolineae bacterium]
MPSSAVITNTPSLIRLLAFDLDGTVLNDQFVISPRVKAAIQEAKARGAHVTIATGRPPAVTLPYAQQIGVTAPIICLQGGLVYDATAGRTLRHITLPHALACELVELEQIHPQWQAVVYVKGDMFMSAKRYDDQFYESLLGKDYSLHADVCDALAGGDPDKVLFIIEPPDAAAILDVLGRLVGARASVVQSHARFVEVNPLGATKGAALAWLAEYLGVPRTSVMAIGDQDNDVSMIEWAGIGVAMSNGSPAARAAADWIAPSIHEDGVAVAIERYVLRTDKA